MVTMIGWDVEPKLDWLELTAAIQAGHKLEKAQITDSFLYQGNATLLSRAAWINGIGIAVKSATVLPDNPAHGRPMIGGAVNLFANTGELSAVLDFHLVTKWKTAADSLLGALKLARADSQKILIVGAGTVAKSLFEAYSAGFPDANFIVWNRTAAKAEALAGTCSGMTVAHDLESAVKEADIITCATMSTEPVVKGAWLQHGQHLDLIGAYRPDMRETDDEALLRSSVFVDSYDTTLGHIGEIKIPLEAETITRDHIKGDFYSIADFSRNEGDITLFKNGGGAHLDLMTSRYILDKWTKA